MTESGFRLLALTKRQYMGKDLLHDRYGRFREIPLELARQGHAVRGVALSYSRRDEVDVVDRDADASVGWSTVNLGKAVVPGTLKHLHRIRRTAEAFQPHIVIAFSDAFHVVRGVGLAHRLGIPAVADLSDNFETYRGTTAIRRQFRAAVRAAELVTCVSDALAAYVVHEYRRSKPTVVLEMGVPLDMFHPGDRSIARQRLDLPDELTLVGYAGAIARSRDIEVAFRAVDRLSLTGKKVGLLIAGPREVGLAWPTSAPVFDLGTIAHDQIPTLIRAVDVVIVPNRSSGFGDYCYPQKLVEAIACDVPIAAARTFALRGIVDPGVLYEPGDVDDCVRALETAMTNGLKTAPRARSWPEVATQLSEALSDLSV